MTPLRQGYDGQGPDDAKPKLPPKLRLCLYEPRADSAYHPSYGTVDLQAGKVLKMTICERDRADWGLALRAILAEFILLNGITGEQAQSLGLTDEERTVIRWDKIMGLDIKESVEEITGWTRGGGHVVRNTLGWGLRYDDLESWKVTKKRLTLTGAVPGELVKQPITVAMQDGELAKLEPVGEWETINAHEDHKVTRIKATMLVCAPLSEGGASEL